MHLDDLIRNVLWNGALAVVPVGLAYMILWISRIRRMRLLRNLVLAGLTIVWLDFLPNTCYLLTEWRHFLYVVDAQNLFIRSQYDRFLLMQLFGLSLFYFLYSGFGMLTFTLAIRPMEHLAARRGASLRFWAVPFFVALSLGVYLGLVLRFNSWDPASRSVGIARIWGAVVELGGRPKLDAFIFAFGIFLWTAYEAVDVWIDGLSERWSRLTGRRMHLGPEMDKPQ